VYRILKENGYYTIYLTNGKTFYFQVKGTYLDETDFLLEFPSFYLLTQPVLDLNRRLSRHAPDPVVKGIDKFTGSLFERIQLAIQEGLQRDSPIHLGFKGGAIHTPLAPGYTWRNREEWIAGGRYQEAVKRSRQELKEIVDYIIAKDPQSVIILLGDHGAWRLRKIWTGANNLSELETILLENGESLQSLADDIFGVLMAIRMPDGAVDISYGYPMSTVNLFRHIFAALSDDAQILKERQPSWSAVGRSWSGRELVLVKEGIVQHVFSTEPYGGR